MPVATPSRQNKTFSSPSIVTPSRSANRSSSSYSNYTPTVMSSGSSGKINIVTRVALEGRAKLGDDGASMKMYLKIAFPLDTVSPGTSVPLFPEENVKILSSQVHPLDNNSVPYNFSSTLSPLLHRAACALNLPARSPESFNSAFDLGLTHSNASSSHSSRASRSENQEAIPPVDSQYTGEILVSGYNITYVPPRHFPTHSSEHGEPYPRPSSRSRRASISERATAQFMVAIDMWVPYLTKPTKYPYLLAIPTPRCLHNHIKLRIITPSSNTSNSYASLSSIEDDSGSWDLTSDPHVTRATTTRLARSNSITQHFADDESSDSSTAGFAEGCGIQGTFPSAERIRIRWARPSRSANVPGGGRDGRRRVGVKTSKGDMVCSIRGKVSGLEPGAPDGVLMDVKYTGSCSGVWFPGVATLLGMDLGLEAKGCDVVWPENGPSQWKVTGGNAYTGFDVGPSTNVPTQHSSRGSSFESNSTNDDLNSLNGSVNGFLPPPNPTNRTNSGASTNSLLRAPLPIVPPGEFSFEGSSSTQANGREISPMGTLSSIGSISGSMSLDTSATPQQPGIPITLHLNINDLLHPAKNVFNFTVQGTVVLIPRHSISRMGQSQSRPSSPLEGYTEGTGLVMLPKFTVLASESEATTTTVRNDMESAHGAVDVYHATKDIYRDAQAKKTVLQKGGYTKCGNEGARIAVKDHDPYKRQEFTSPGSLHRPTTPLSSARPGTSLAMVTRSPRVVAGTSSSSSSISVVAATVLPFPAQSAEKTTVYSVTIQLNVPVLRDTEWMDFGFAMPEVGTSQGSDQVYRPPSLQLLSAMVDGLPVEADSTGEPDAEPVGLGAEDEKPEGKKWLSWVNLRVAGLQGGKLTVEYLVRENMTGQSTKGKEKAQDELPVLLPTFTVPVAKYDVTVNQVRDFELLATYSNFGCEQTVPGGQRFMQFSVNEFFYPKLALQFTKRNSNTSTGTAPRVTLYFVFTWILLAITCLTALRALARSQTLQTTAIHQPITTPQTALDNEVPSLTVTSTSTVFETVTNHATTTITSRVTELHERPSSSSTQSTPSPSSSSSSTTVTLSSSSAETRPPPVETTTTTTTPMPRPTPAPTAEPDQSSAQHSETPVHLGMQPFRDAFPFAWPDDIDLTTAKEVYVKITEVAAVMWKYMQKAYHYPLEVPS